MVSPHAAAMAAFRAQTAHGKLKAVMIRARLQAFAKWPTW
jgi:hypothetical protein